MMTARPEDSALIWRKSSASAGIGECVEVAASGTSIFVRDSRNRSGTVLAFTQPQWRGLLRRIRGGH
jgi:hypothetical protein